MLVVFVLKLGLVAACASHDFSDEAVAAAEQAPAKAQLQGDTGDDGQPPEPSASGGCVDCHCHHLATLVADVLPHVTVAPASEPASVPVSERSVSPVQELRPPIV